MRALILPGLDGCPELRHEFVEALRPGIEATVVSLPTDRFLDYHGIAELAKDELRGQEPFLLMGESFSGPAAILLAATDPPGLRGLVLCATFARRPVHLFPTLRRLATRFPFQAMPMQLVMRGMMGRWSSREWSRRLQVALESVRPDVLRDRVATVLDVDVTQALAMVQCPILFIAADADRIVWTDGWKPIHAVRPAATCVRIAGPHMLLQAVPQDVATAIKQWAPMR